MNEAYFNTGFKVVKRQSQFLLFVAGIRPKVIGDFPSDGRTYILCPNHSSYIDILILYAIYPHYIIFLGKKELGKVPLLNIFFKKMNILIDRVNAKASHESITAVVKQMNKGRSVVIFPEGTISKSAPEMRPFKNGAFRVALENKISILPISLPKNHRLLEDSFKWNAKCGPGKAPVYIHQAIEMDKFASKDLIPLREEVREIIASKLDHERRS